MPPGRQKSRKLPANRLCHHNDKTMPHWVPWLSRRNSQLVLHRAQPAGAFKHGEFKNSPHYWTPGLTQWKLSAEGKFSWSISVMLFGRNREEPNASFRMILCIHFSSCRISCILIFTLHFMRKWHWEEPRRQKAWAVLLSQSHYFLSICWTSTSHSWAKITKVHPILWWMVFIIKCLTFCNPCSCKSSFILNWKKKIFSIGNNEIIGVQYDGGPSASGIVSFCCKLRMLRPWTIT